MTSNISPRRIQTAHPGRFLVLRRYDRPAGCAHAVADEGDEVRNIAAVIGRRLGLPVESVPTETYGPLGPIFATDQPSSSTHPRQALGWQPKHPSLLEDLANIQP
ncbi:hypothetical protein ACFXBB_35925 [Streptomyces scopuliridis]|uniref:hypothetical protein n=1 Tax=Streptomyces scopuliridis TaxID=452529 RepID=UPI0036C09C04